jgi:hypothetical protein
VIFMSKCRQVHIRKTGKDTQIIDHWAPNAVFESTMTDY